MKFTLNECLARINQVLNYPAISYEDVYHFFDQAIEELNTTLRIALPTVSEMVSENTFDILEQDNLVRLTTKPTDPVQAVQKLPDYSSDGPDYVYFCEPTKFSTRKIYKWMGDWTPFTKLYGMYFETAGNSDAYILVPISPDRAIWAPVDATRIQEFDLTEYLPMSWWTLFIIPYVCFKYSVRSGDSGQLFVDEFTQGFQQLQTNYNVPNTVAIKNVAGRPAYKNIVEENLHNLNARVPTRAIFDSMRVETGIQSVFGGFYETGGWGV